jgi:putative transposase
MKDRFTGEVVGHAMGAQRTTDVVSDAFKESGGGEAPMPRLAPPLRSWLAVWAQVYQEHLRQDGLIPSRNRKGNCSDNAPMESFWRTLKNELVHHRCDAPHESARRAITASISLSFPGLTKRGPAHPSPT